MEKILVIDDSPVQAEFLKSILKDEHDVTTCSSSEEGLKEAMSGKYSLIFLDVIMPEMDGFTLLRKLQEMIFTKYIPVIMITGLADVEHEEQGLVLGAVDYITKPFSPVIVKARANTHLRLHHFMQQAMVDELTGIANRRRYEDDSIMKWKEAVRLGLPFSVCMIDIDKFKVYNDTFGHPAGDKVLATVAKTVSSCMQRATDFFGRYGGEEFVAILIGNQPHAAYEFMKTIRQAVEDLHIPHNPETAQWVTISIGGITVFPKADDSYNACLKAADTMLYQAKDRGRNMVVWSNNNQEQWNER